MSRSRPRGPWLRLQKMTFLAIAYFSLGKLSLLLASPPDFAAPVWPSAGLALAAVLIFGTPMWPGIWIGAFAVNAVTRVDPSTLATIFQSSFVPALMACGATLQALAGRYLIGRFSCIPEKLAGSREISGLVVLGGPVSCVVSAAFGVAALVISGAVTPDNALYSLMTWWVGDSIGVILFSPLVLIWMIPNRGSWRRRAAVTLPLAMTLSLVALIFAVSSRWENEHLVAGLLFAGLLGVILLSMTGRTILVEETVARRTAELEHKKRQLAEAQHLSRIGSWEWDVATDRVLWSEQLYKNFDRIQDETELTSRTHLENIHPDDCGRVETLIGEAFQSTEAFSFEYRIIVNDGTERVLHSRAEVSRDVEGRAVRMFGTCQDVTEMKRAEKAVLAASRAKGEFVANVSHELRTPLNGIIGMLEIVKETRVSPEQAKYLNAASSAADSLLLLINDILDMSKMEAGKLDLEPIDFRFRDSMEETVLTLTSIAEQKGLVFQCTIAPDVPEQIVGDPGRLRQILLNLAANAIKFTDQGQVHVAVDVDNAVDESVTLHFSVMDTGIGIPHDRAAAIFDPYTQAERSTTRRFGGTGLGLSISAELVRNMGGRIWVESELGTGSTFHFTVVLGRAKCPSIELPAGSTDFMGTTILVVDSRASGRAYLKDVLGRWHIETESAEDGASALDALKRRASSETGFGLVMVDAFLPDMDGFDFVDQMKAIPEFREIPVSLLTSSGRPGDASRCRKAGISAYLSKPVSPTDILNMVATILRRSSEEEASHLVTRHSVRENRPSLSVLLAEDQPFNQMVAVHLIEKEGHTVQVVENGLAAVEACRDATFDLVLMDVQMPIMDGLEATVAIRKMEEITGKHVCIVAMTARAMQEDRDRCTAVGMDGYLSKPFRAREFIETLEGLRLNFTPAPGLENSSPATGRPMIDRAALLAELHGDVGMLSQLAGMFRRQSRERLGEISEAVSRGDMEAVRLNAHAIKGAISFWTQEAPYESAINIEHHAHEGNLDAVCEAWRALEIQFAEMEMELETLKTA